MHINRISEPLKGTLLTAVQRYFSSWHEIPADVDVENLNVERIRYIADWSDSGDGLNDDAFIFEIETETDSYREVISRSDLHLTVEEFKVLLEEENKDGRMFGKEVVANQSWYEYPVIYGELDDTFDTEAQYAAGGTYEDDTVIE